jgi:molybdopterin molybdotransferase
MTAPEAVRPKQPGGLLSVEEARDRVLAAIGGPLEAEWAELADALGRVLVADVVAATSLPPWDNSAMDGYAVRSTDTQGASEDEPRRLRVIGEVAAGAAPDIPVGPGEAVRIATGAPVPEGADSVIPVELTTPADATGRAVGERGGDATGPPPATILAHATVEPGGSIRREGSDVRAGVVVIPAGSPVSASAVALIAGSGTARVAVHRRPRVGVLATGDEIRAPGEPLGAAGIPDANRPALLAQVAVGGGEGVDLGIARDDLEAVLGALRRAVAADVDVVIVSGGVSVGPYDVVKAAFDALGRIDLWRVNVQPGKPFAFGAIEREGRAPVLLFGLPGNPVSSLVTFDLFVRPALRRLAGHTRLLRQTDRAVLSEPVSKSHGRRAFLRVIIDRDPDGRAIRDDRGRLTVRLAGGQGSHVISALAVADALAIVPEATDELPAGAEVELWWLDAT